MESSLLEDDKIQKVPIFSFFNGFIITVELKTNKFTLESGAEPLVPDGIGGGMLSGGSTFRLSGDDGSLFRDQSYGISNLQISIILQKI